MNEYTAELIHNGFFNWRWRIRMVDQAGEAWYLDSSDRRMYFKRNAESAAQARIEYLQYTDRYEKERSGG